MDILPPRDPETFQEWNNTRGGKDNRKGRTACSNLRQQVVMNHYNPETKQVEPPITGWRSPATSEPGVSLDRLVDSEGNPWTPGQRAYDKITGRLAQVGLTHEAQAAIPIAGFPTPCAGDKKWMCSQYSTAKKRADSGKQVYLEAMLHLNLSPVETAKPAGLAPALPRWLMGYPVEWCQAAIRAHRAMPTKRRKQG
jgi:hypothetical protein